jgi:hypothetical protein
MHEPKQNGASRLFPVKGPNILSLEGSQMKELIDSHRKENSAERFEDHVLNRTERVSRITQIALFNNEE